MKLIDSIIYDVIDFTTNNYHDKNKMKYYESKQFKKQIETILNLSGKELNNFEDFYINKFLLWREKNIKLKSMITKSDYLIYLDDRKKHSVQIKNMYNNNLNLAEYYFNNNK